MPILDSAPTSTLAATTRRSCSVRTALLTGLAVLVVSALLLPSSRLTLDNARHALDYPHGQYGSPIDPKGVVCEPDQSQPPAPPPPPPPEPAKAEQCVIAGKVWEECGEGDDLCAKYGEAALLASRVYTGPALRLRRVMRKAQRGESIKIGVLGGSVSAGHAITHENQPRIYHRQIWKWFQEAFPNSEVTFSNGAVAAQGTNFHKLCFRAHLDEDVDLVLVDAAINDQRHNQDAATNMEWLLRGLMVLPNKPAVVQVQLLALLFEQISLGGDLHTPVAEYYGSPVISLRPVILPLILKDPELIREYYYIEHDGVPDTRHVGLNGHDLMAQLVIAYFRTVLCSLSHELKPGKLMPSEADDVPSQLLMSKFDLASPAPTYVPMCNSTSSHLRPLVAAGGAWVPEITNRKSYWTGHKPGERIWFDVDLRQTGTVTITYIRSATYGLGIAKCWVDDEASAVFTDGYWTNAASIGQNIDIATNVPPGMHKLTCEVQAETHEPQGRTRCMIAAVVSA